MEINYLAVLAAAVASIIIGSVWYGGIFRKKFASIMGFDKLSPEQQSTMKKNMGMTYFTQFLASLIMFYVLARFLNDGAVTNSGEGVIVSLWVWIGFVVPVKLGDAIWGGKMTLFWLGAGNMLITLIASGAIIGAWQ